MNALPDWFDWADVAGDDSPLERPTLAHERLMTPEEREQALLRKCVVCGDEFTLDWNRTQRRKCFNCSPRREDLPKVKAGKPEVEPDPEPEYDPIRRQDPDEDEVIDWWTAYDRGESIESIARAWDRPLKMVLAKLDELEVLNQPYTPSKLPYKGADPKPCEDPASQLILMRAEKGLLSPHEKAIMDALAKISCSDFPRRQPVPSVRVQIHKVNARTHEPMSARERRQNAMATSYWRRTVRREMARLGIMPRWR